MQPSAECGQGSAKKKILIIDDHPLLRKGLASVINQTTDLMVQGEAEDARKALEMIEKLQPDLLIVDISLPGIDGVELLNMIRTRFGELPSLVLSMHDESVFAERALRAGSRGYMMKQEALEKVLVAIRRVLAGEIFVSNNIATKMIKKLVEGNPQKTASPLELLSNREFTVFQLIGQGFQSRQIAEKLHISTKTVESYRAHIKEKLKLNNAKELMKYAILWVQNHA
jgi:DNA-binding NarL/FixJ family response regulator